MLIYKQFIKPIPYPQQSGSFGLSHCLRQKEAKAIKKLDDPFWLTEITTKELLFSPRNLSSWSLKIPGSLCLFLRSFCWIGKTNLRSQIQLFPG